MTTRRNLSLFLSPAPFQSFTEAQVRIGKVVTPMLCNTRPPFGLPLVPKNSPGVGGRSKSIPGSAASVICRGYFVSQQVAVRSVAAGRERQGPVRVFLAPWRRYLVAPAPFRLPARELLGLEGA